MSALERRGAQSVLKATPVPGALADVGIRIGVHEDSGMTEVFIPPEVRKSLNVLDPVTSFAQADPNWTPAIRVVQLVQDLHSFPIQGKRALNKQALELLGRAAGVLYSRIDRVRRDELGDDEPWAYRATIGIRRSDGTVDEITRERSAGEDAQDAKFGREKTQSKAVLRAIRAALQIPHAFSEADFAKPFVVIGYSFTPDYHDEETKRLLVAAGLNAQAAIYGGGRTVSREIEAPATPHESDEHGSEPASTGEAAGQQAGAAVPSPAAASVPDDDAELAAEFGADDVAQAKAAADEGGQFVLPEGAHKGKTVFQVAAGAGGEKRIKMLLKLPNHAAHAAALAFASHYLPELIVAAEQEARAAKEVAA